MVVGVTDLRALSLLSWKQYSKIFFISKRKKSYYLNLAQLHHKMRRVLISIAKCYFWQHDKLAT